MDPDVYAQMMADLGPNRIESLPLAGDKNPPSGFIRRPLGMPKIRRNSLSGPSDGKSLAKAWGEYSADAEVPKDSRGIGGGTLYRDGQNYRPTADILREIRLMEPRDKFGMKKKLPPPRPMPPPPLSKDMSRHVFTPNTAGGSGSGMFPPQDARFSANHTAAKASVIHSSAPKNRPAMPKRRNSLTEVDIQKSRAEVQRANKLFQEHYLASMASMASKLNVQNKVRTTSSVFSSSSKTTMKKAEQSFKATPEPKNDTAVNIAASGSGALTDNKSEAPSKANTVVETSTVSNQANGVVKTKVVIDLTLDDDDHENFKDKLRAPLVINKEFTLENVQSSLNTIAGILSGLRDQVKTRKLPVPANVKLPSEPTTVAEVRTAYNALQMRVKALEGTIASGESEVIRLIEAVTGEVKLLGDFMKKSEAVRIDLATLQKQKELLKIKGKELATKEEMERRAVEKAAQEKLAAEAKLAEEKKRQEELAKKEKEYNDKLRQKEEAERQKELEASRRLEDAKRQAENARRIEAAHIEQQEKQKAAERAKAAEETKKAAALATAATATAAPVAPATAAAPNPSARKLFPWSVKINLSQFRQDCPDIEVAIDLKGDPAKRILEEIRKNVDDRESYYRITTTDQFEGFLNKVRAAFERRVKMMH